MCGIACITKEDPTLIEKMTRSIAHRGPDDLQTLTQRGISMGHARLSILDLSEKGRQPMWNKGHSVVIAYNGEVYNFRRLIQKHNLQCSTGTDTEVLLKLYDRQGILFVRELVGMFAFTLYDTRTKTLYLCRDPGGIKPLFYTEHNGVLYAASEMKALLAGIPEKPSINLQSLSNYLRLQYVPGPETLCKSIKQLPAGSILTYARGTSKINSFATDVDVKKIQNSSDIRAYLPNLMDEIIEDHLISDRPVGIFLSGGMDSSIVLHHAAHHTSSPIKTFTLRFAVREDEDPERFNTDANLAKQTARHYGTDHHEILFDAAMCADVYKASAIGLDQPNADSTAMANHILAQAAVRDVAVVLNGSGGDELFGGYPRYRIAHILHALRFLPSSFRILAGKITGYPTDVLRMQPGALLAERLLARPASEAQQYVRQDWFDSRHVTRLFQERFATLDNNDPVRSFMEFDRNLWLIDESLRLTDGATMAHGLECRVPFVDQRIIQMIKNTPGNRHLNMSNTKVLLKSIYKELLPPHLFTLKKACFYPPLAKWFRRDCAHLMEHALDNDHIRSLFDVAVLSHIFKEHQNRTEYNLHTIANITQLGYWFENVYDAVSE